MSLLLVAPKHSQRQHRLRGLQDGSARSQTDRGGRELLRVLSRPGCGRERGSGCQAEREPGGTGSHPEGVGVWEHSGSPEWALGGGVDAPPQHPWVPWGGCAREVPPPCLIRCGGSFFPLAETSCAATEFRCRDGSCIGNSSRCNQFIDCEDASDEMNCSECPAAAPDPSSALETLLPSVPVAGTWVFGICAELGREEGPAPVPQL